jgi:hypothetical protein
MGNSYLNLIVFIVSTTFYYFVLKPSLTLKILNNVEEYQKYMKSGYTNLGIYLFIVIITQIVINIYSITSDCGGNTVDNVGPGALLTFFPWCLIFGVLIIVLILYPGFKIAFSDVIGYFYVANSANNLLTELLIDKDVEDEMNEGNVDTKSKIAIQNAADIIIKIAGNRSILINQIVPDNFNNFWTTLRPLMKTKFQLESPETEDIKDKFFKIVVTRDNVGEAMWFIYTGILVVSLVQLNITNRGCVSDAATMEKNYQAFLDDQKELEEENKKKTDVTYTV